ncbi:MAG TPA: Sec-independent protein translocase protein TatB [Dongiaceae bacterium]|nr:Sec-independent protein translocase protein TatB [Dongiaceae bacterium]
MFDIGFFELVLVGIVALVVLGPDKLPHAVRMTGAWMGRMRRLVANVRDEFEREVNLHEMEQRIREQLEKAGIEDARKALEDTRRTLEDTRDSLTQQHSIAPPAQPAPAQAAVHADDDPDTRHNPPLPENELPEPPPPTDKR